MIKMYPDINLESLKSKIDPIHLFITTPCIIGLLIAFYGMYKRDKSDPPVNKYRQEKAFESIQSMDNVEYCASVAYGSDAAFKQCILIQQFKDE